MIARKWTGTVSRQDADAYEEFLTGEHGIDEYRSIPGNRGALLLRRDAAATTEFELISIWDDVEALKAYAGCEYEQPRYYPTDLAMLIDPPQLVEHHSVAACDLPELKRSR
jgi:heme-degrading monooxygenase HmoA